MESLDERKNILVRSSDSNDLLEVAAESRIGGRKENQDSFGFKETALGYLVTVCDGMGGGPGGKTASTIAVTEIIKGIDEASADQEVANTIIKAIRQANMAIIEAGNRNPKLKGMGSTATVLLISKTSAYIAHVGDSRVYQLRGGNKVFRTFDHSMVFDMVAKGVITEEQARLSAESNIITRALGIKPDVEVDVQELPFEKGDRFALCTDGIHGTMPEKDLIKMFSNRQNPLVAVTDDIATFVDNIGHTAGGGHDNLTLVLVETKVNSKLKKKMSKQAKFLIIVLVALLAASAALNVTQYNSKTTVAEVDSTAIRKAAEEPIIKQLNDTVKFYEKQISDLKEHVSSLGAKAQNKPQIPGDKSKVDE